MPAGLAHHRLEPVRPRRLDGRSESRPQSVQAPERDGGARPVDPQHRPDGLRGGALEQRVADGDVERRVVGEAVADEQHEADATGRRALVPRGRGVT